MTDFDMGSEAQGLHAELPPADAPADDEGWGDGGEVEMAPISVFPNVTWT